MNRYTHLTDANRLQIEHGLRNNSSIRKIAALIGKHHSTVAREILARRVESLKGAAGRITNRPVAEFLGVEATNPLAAFAALAG